MKNFLLTACFLSMVVVTFAQESFHVVHVKGTVKIKSSGELVTSGSKISADTQLLFGDASSMAAVISTKKGRFILAPSSSKSGSSELSFYVKDIISEASGKLSTRGINNTLLDLRHYLTGNQVYLDGEGRIELNSVNIPMDLDRFFFIRYSYDNQTINKKLSFEKNELIISANEIYQIDGTAINEKMVQDMTLFYYNQAEKQSTEVVKFHPIFPENTTLLTEVGMLIEFMEYDTVEQKKADIEAYISDTYGKVSQDNLNKWLKIHFNI